VWPVQVVWRATELEENCCAEHRLIIICKGLVSLGFTALVSLYWKDLTDSVNSMAGNLTSQVRNIADVTKAVANGDSDQKITVDVKGEILELSRP